MPDSTFTSAPRALDPVQAALLNMLEDLTAERGRLQAGQRAVLNILEDSDAEKSELRGAQRAVINILEDSETEKASLQDAQRAMINILEDVDVEKSKVEFANRSLQSEVRERKRAELEISNLNRELKQYAADLAAANRELEAFAYSVSHDLRAPLRHMDGFLALLVERLGGRLDEQTRRYLDKVTAASSTMGKLIDDLLQFSRAGRSELTRKPLNLRQLVEDVRAELESEAAGRAVRWEIGLLPEVSADPAMLRLVITNLLLNALKFTRPRSVARIAIGSAASQNDIVVFVRDNGVGFDMQYAGKLFRVFQRLHQAGDFEGTGIGLANVQRIIERHGGRVWAEGSEGVGACFYFSLPASPIQEAGQ